jgi:hypothetical protein
MGQFDINWDDLVKQNTPQEWQVNSRTELPCLKRMARLNATMIPVKYLYNIFIAFVNATTYDLNHNGQVVHLEAVLNDAFDDTLRRIVIVDGPDEEPVYIYLPAELKPVPLYTTAEAKPVYLYTDAEIAALGPDFIVEIPAAVSFNAQYLDGLIQKYKLTSKTYSILIV